MLVDVHQHLWTAELVEALAARDDRPFIRPDHGLTVLHLAGEQPYVIDCQAEAPERRAALVALDGLDRALVCLSSPLGIEALPRRASQPLLAAYLDGALASVHGLGILRPVLQRLEELDAPLFVHPGPAPGSPARESRLDDPLWWP